MTAITTLHGNHAPQACVACRKRKGRCDRALPCCNFCKKRSQLCYYPDKSVQTALHQTTCFPPAFFLDHGLLGQSSFMLPPPDLEVPSYVSAEIGGFMQQNVVASRFFATIHLWMPIISKRQCFNTLLNPLSLDRPDVALLCLTMKLMLWVPSVRSSDPHTTTYIAARQFLYSWEISRTLTLPILQAAILITLYEIGHGIYPAAYLSIGVCVQYAAALGLNWRTTYWREGDRDWVESEERRRVWWAIVILERYISLGHQQRRVITEGPSRDELLPIDDTAWDLEIMVPRYSMTVSAPSNINMGRFARLSQATYLLGRVLKHLQDDTVFSESLMEEDIQLDKALHALLAFTASETNRRDIRICSQAALCQSALALLHIPWLYPRHESEAVENRSSLAWDAMDQLSNEFLNYSRRTLQGIELPFHETSPLALHWGYQALIHFRRLSHKYSRSDTALAEEIVQNALKLANTRWKLAEIYLELFTARVISRSPID
ncbi:fungal-specific transcription factor domain-containing protein [Trichoderma barbatum]